MKSENMSLYAMLTIALIAGPYVIHKRLPNDRYVVRDIEGFQQTQISYDRVLESDKLRRWIASGTDLASESLEVSPSDSLAGPDLG